MGIYRGAGGSGDAINDSSSEALITLQARDAALAAQAAAEAAQVAAELAETNAETAETNAETAETNAETAETNAETAQAAAEVAQAAAEAVLVDPDFVAVVAIEADITTVAGIAADVTTVAGISADVTSVAAIDSDVSTVASDIADVTTVASNIGSVNTVSGISSNVTTVAGISSNVTTVAGISSNVTTVAGISGNVTTVAGISSNVTTVAGISADVTTVAGDSADIQLLADNIATIAAKANAGANSDITSLSGLTTPLSVGQGGTGANTLTGYVKGAGTTALTASSTIPNTDITGLGTMSTQAASNVAITGGSINGTTVGASTAASGAFTSLTSSSTTTLNGTTIPASKTLLVSTDIGSTVQAYDAQLADVAGLTPTDNNFIVGNGTNFVTESGSTARTSLGLGSIATQDSSNVTVTGGSINGTTVGASTATTGKFTTLEATGVTTVQAGTVSLPAITTTGDTNTGIFFPAADTIAFAKGGAEAMRIDSSGNVGIGTTSIGARLDIAGTAGTLRITSTTGTNGVNLRVNNTGGDFYFGRENSTSGAFGVTAYSSVLWSEGAYPMVFATNNTERMRIDSSGNLLVGTTTALQSGSNRGNITIGGSASSVLNLGTGATTQSYLFHTQTGNELYLVNTANGPAIFYTNNAESMRITATGNVGIGTSSPSAKLNVIGGNIRLDNNQGLEWAGSNNYIYGNETTDFIVIATNGNEAMRIDSSGRVGIGTSAPQLRFQVSGTNSTNGDASRNTIIFDTTSATTGVGGGISFGGYYDGTSSAINDFASIQGFKENSTANNFAGALRFTTRIDGGAPTERMRITSGGYVKASNNGVYVSSTGIYHEMISDGDNTSLIVRNTNGSLTAGGVLYVDANRNTTNNAFYAISYYNNGAGAYKFQVADSGNVTNTNNSYGAISDVKLKENIVDASPKLEDLCKVKVRQYNLKSDPDHKQIGVVAQELEEVFAGLVEETADKDREGNYLGTTTKQVKYSVFVPMLIKAMQEQQALIENLTTRLNALEGK